MQPKKILVVDDEPEIVDLLQEVLEEQGYQTQAADNATSALQLVRDNIYDAAILDFNLPDMNGVMLHHKIREMDEELSRQTLFISGFAQSEENLGYFTACAGGFLPKPFTVEQVLEALSSVWGAP